MCVAIFCRWSYPGGFTEAKKSVRARNTAQWLRGAILQLGPTFIKLGQLFRQGSCTLPCSVAGCCGFCPSFVMWCRSSDKELLWFFVRCSMPAVIWWSVL